MVLQLVVTNDFPAALGSFIYFILLHTYIKPLFDLNIWSYLAWPRDVVAHLSCILYTLDFGDIRLKCSFQFGDNW